MSKTERKAFRKDHYVLICTFSYILSLIFRIPLLYMIGEKGVAYFSIANEIYILAGGLFTYGLSKAVSMLIRYRIKREQYKNADRVLQGALLLASVTGIIIGVFVLLAGEWIAGQVAGVPLAGLAVCMVSFSIIFQMLTGVFRGYFEGNGSRVPSMHSVVLKSLVMIPAGLIGASLLRQYGAKVSALLKVEDYASAYGAMGAMIGILAASVLGFLHMLLLYFIYHGKAKKQTARELQKNPDKRLNILHMLIGTAVPFACYAVSFRIVPLLDGIFFVRAAKEGIDATQLWGNYYGKYLVVIGIISFLVSLAGSGQMKKIIYFMERDEFRMAREKMGALIHQTALISIPAAIFTAVLAENFLNLLFKGNNDDIVYHTAWGSIIIVLFAFSGLFADFLIRLENLMHVIFYEVIALVMHVALTLILLKNTDLSLMAVVISNIVSFIVLMVIGFLLLCRRLQYRQEWIHTFAFPVIDAAIAGIAVMLLNRLFASFAGTTIALIVSLPLGIILYMVLLIVTRAVTERELGNMAGGRILLTLGRWMRFM